MIEIGSCHVTKNFCFHVIRYDGGLSICGRRRVGRNGASYKGALYPDYHRLCSGAYLQDEEQGYLLIVFKRQVSHNIPSIGDGCLRTATRGPDGRLLAAPLPIASEARQQRRRLADAVKKRPAQPVRAAVVHRSVHKRARTPLPRANKRARV